MQLSCPSCQATFRVPEGAIPPSGRVVRCAKCKHEWHATIAPALTEVENLLRYNTPAMDNETQDAAAPNWATMPQAADDELSNDPRFAASAMAAAHDDVGQQAAHDFERSPEAPEVEEVEYKVTEEEMAAFAGLVSQEELDAIPTTSNSALEALTGETLEEMPDFDAVLASLETAEEDTVAIPKLRPFKKNQKPLTDNVVATKELLFPRLTKHIAYATAALLLAGISLTFLAGYVTIRHNAPALDKVYKMLGYASSEGVELVDMKMEKTQLPGKTTYDISGAILNRAGRSVPVPAVRIRLVDKDNNTLRQWDFSQEKMMKPNESIPFNAPKLRALGGTEDSAYAFIVDIGNGLEMRFRD